jgi:hypothetical protein
MLWGFFGERGGLALSCQIKQLALANCVFGSLIAKGFSPNPLTAGTTYKTAAAARWRAECVAALADALNA